MNVPGWEDISHPRQCDEKMSSRKCIIAFILFAKACVMPRLCRTRAQLNACSTHRFAFLPNHWHSEDRMNRFLSFFKRRPTVSTLTSFFSTNSPRLAVVPQSNMSPVNALSHLPSSASRESYGNFDLVERVKLAGFDITVSSWLSRITGIKVVHLDYEGERTTAACLPLLACASCSLCQ
jgi:hypothetical protein